MGVNCLPPPNHVFIPPTASDIGFDLWLGSVLGIENRVCHPQPFPKSTLHPKHLCPPAVCMCWQLSRWPKCFYCCVNIYRYHFERRQESNLCLWSPSNRRRPGLSPPDHGDRKRRVSCWIREWREYDQRSKSSSMRGGRLADWFDLIYIGAATITQS